MKNKMPPIDHLPMEQQLVVIAMYKEIEDLCKKIADSQAKMGSIPKIFIMEDLYE